MKKKLFSTMAMTLLLGSCLVLGAGCGKKTVVPPDGGQGGTDMSGGTNINYPMAEGGGYSEGNLPAEGTLDDARNGGGMGMDTAADMQSDEYKRLHGRSSPNLFPVYFDFDQARIRPDMQEVMARNAEVIRSAPNATLVIEGNSDERGTNEYNLALGERRAINVQQYLMSLGVNIQRSQTLSYGEERPLFLGQDEDSYAHNRRVDFILK